MINANETITIINRYNVNGIDYLRTTILSNCNWVEETKLTLEYLESSNNKLITCRIPESAKYTADPLNNNIDKFNLKTGDYIVKGQLLETDLTPDNILDILDKYEYAEIASVKVNTVGFLNHYHLIGEVSGRS